MAAKIILTLITLIYTIHGASATFSLYGSSFGSSSPAIPWTSSSSSSPFSATHLTLLKDVLQKLAPTLWCGIDNIAPNPDAVSAVYPHLDSCCRDHDNCPELIERNQCLRGICNNSPILPILSCDCERRFLDCLASLPSSGILARIPVTLSERLLTDKIGHFYFRLLPTLTKRQCIRTKAKASYSFSYRCEGDPEENGSGSGKGDRFNGPVKVWKKCWKVPLTANTWELVDLLEMEQEWFQAKPYLDDVAKAASNVPSPSSILSSSLPFNYSIKTDSSDGSSPSTYSSPLPSVL